MGRRLRWAQNPRWCQKIDSENEQYWDEIVFNKQKCQKSMMNKITNFK